MRYRNSQRFQETIDRLAAQYEPCLRDLRQLVEESKGITGLRPQERINIGGAYRLLESSEFNLQLLVEVVRNLRESTERHYIPKKLTESTDFLDRAIRLINQTTRSRTCKETQDSGN